MELEHAELPISCSKCFPRPEVTGCHFLQGFSVSIGGRMPLGFIMCIDVHFVSDGIGHLRGVRW